MSKDLALYKALIDGLFERKESITARRVQEQGLPQVPENDTKNAWLVTLSPEHKQLLAQMLQAEYSAGMHATLAYLNEKRDLEGLQLIQDGETLSNTLFESLLFDFVCHCEGEDWPQ